MNWPKITVVTPSYNQAKYLRKTLESIHSQQYPALEHIVIDGGSKDGSLEILREYAHYLAYWVSEPDQGQTDALIKGFSRATGDILCWLNSDDLFEHYTLRTVGQHFLNNPETRFFYGDARWIGPDDEVLYERREMNFIRWIWLYGYNYIPQPSAFWTRGLYEQVGGLDHNFKLSMDGDLFARFSRTTYLQHLPIVLSRFRFYPEQRNQKYRALSLEEDQRILERELRRTPSDVERVAMRLLSKGVRVAERTGRQVRGR